jgi:cupin 2 domain-containing protein
MSPIRTGHLLDGAAAPEHGEREEPVASIGPARIEQILSGRLAGPLDFDQDHDEWVAVLDGAAELDVAGQRVALGPGDWVLLPRRTPHRVVAVAPGTSWLAVHGPPS